jgi:hypothetical protein
MIGLVEDERWFSTLAFKKNKIKKYIYWLIGHGCAHVCTNILHNGINFLEWCLILLWKATKVEHNY